MASKANKKTEANGKATEAARSPEQASLMPEATQASGVQGAEVPISPTPVAVLTAQVPAEKQETPVRQNPPVSKPSKPSAATKPAEKPAEKPGGILVQVIEASRQAPIRDACIRVKPLDVPQLAARMDDPKIPDEEFWRYGLTDAQGQANIGDLYPGVYLVEYTHFPTPQMEQKVTVQSAMMTLLKFAPEFDICFSRQVWGRDGQPKKALPAVGDTVQGRLDFHFSKNINVICLQQDVLLDLNSQYPFQFLAKEAGSKQLVFQFGVPRLDRFTEMEHKLGRVPKGEFAKFNVTEEVMIMAAEMETPPGRGNVKNPSFSLDRSESDATESTAFWNRIRHSTEALSYEHYAKFVNSLFGVNKDQGNIDHVEGVLGMRTVPFTNGEAYRILKAATEAFVMINCGVAENNADTAKANQRSQVLERSSAHYTNLRDVSMLGSVEANYNNYLSENGILPYLEIIRRKMPEVPLSVTTPTKYEAALGYQMVQQKLDFPCMLELIWSYWHEEGMLVQTMNAITRRFQNVRSPYGNDPLANLEIDPLRPLNNIIWGYTQDEPHRLSVVRRNYEYDHHYGLRLEGRAVKNFRPVDTRSKFLEAFHHLLRMCSQFYKQDDDTTVKADAFPVLNALKEVHLVLSQGAHNQYGDLPSTARVEMLMQQWMLARPEFRDFLPTRMMVAYPEPWMDRVDAMKKLQGWSDTSVLHFRSLAMFGEQVLLSVRFGAWSDIYEPAEAFNWARFWRPQVQGYIHAYRAATGVDLTGTAVDAVVDATMPSVLLQRRLDQQARSA